MQRILRLAVQAALLALAAGFAGQAGAAPAIRVLDTFPAGDAVTLAPNQTFYVRLAYETDEPVQIWVRPWFEGREVRAGSNPSPVYTGNGEALGWFFLMDGADAVDELRVTAGDGTEAGTALVLRHPVRIRAGRAAAAGAEPGWVGQLRGEHERLQREAYEQRMNTPVSAGDTAFAAAFMLAVLALGVGGIAAPLWAIRRWHGRWRLAAAAPLAVMALVVLRILVDTARDPTSHNLWPFEILQASVLSLLVVGVLLAARKLTATAG
ncbi:MAG TPA: hypothetical protein VFY03_13985 [Woeseiaceae bacterium]|nr:hypothetical protein [Woeseiaceae bacterium]